MILNAHGQGVDQDGQQDALLEVLVLHQPPDVAPHPAADPRQAPVHRDQASRSRRPLAVSALVQRRQSVLVEIVAAGIVLHVVAGGGVAVASAGLRVPLPPATPGVPAVAGGVVVVVMVVRAMRLLVVVLLAPPVVPSLSLARNGSHHHGRHGGGLKGLRGFGSRGGLGAGRSLSLVRVRSWLVVCLQGLGCVRVAAGQGRVEGLEGTLARRQGRREGHGEGQQLLASHRIVNAQLGAVGIGIGDGADGLR